MENTENEKIVTNEDVVNAFIENDKKQKEELKLESLDMKSKLILLKYRVKEISDFIDNSFNTEEE